MENENIETHTCENCKYFYQHYAISKNHLAKIDGKGHCINDEIHFKTKEKIIINHMICELWQPVELLWEVRANALEISLKHLAKQLNEIQLILKEYNNFIKNK